MRGPDFEIPPLDPPVPPVDQSTPPRPTSSRTRRVRAAALAAVLASSGVGAFAWYSAEQTSPSTPPRTDPPLSTGRTTEPLASTTSSSRATTTTGAASVTRTCLDSNESPGAAGGTSPEGFPWITFHASPRVAREALVRIAQQASEAREAFGDAGALGVRVYCDIEELAAASGTTPEEAQTAVTEGRVAYMVRGDIWFYGPRLERLSTLDQRQTVYHEYFHALQRSLSRTRTSRTDVEHPLWLLEGSAEFFENAVRPRDLENFQRTQVRRWEAMPALGDLEQEGGARAIGGTGAAYVVGAVAIDYLVKKHGREPLQSSLWLALADTDWRSAFLQVFGISVDTFYSEFATYRQTLRP